MNRKSPAQPLKCFISVYQETRLGPKLDQWIKASGDSITYSDYDKGYWFEYMSLAHSLALILQIRPAYYDHNGEVVTLDIHELP